MTSNSPQRGWRWVAQATPAEVARALNAHQIDALLRGNQTSKGHPMATAADPTQTFAKMRTAVAMLSEALDELDPTEPAATPTNSPATPAKPNMDAAIRARAGYPTGKAA